MKAPIRVRVFVSFAVAANTSLSDVRAEVERIMLRSRLSKIVLESIDRSAMVDSVNETVVCEMNVWYFNIPIRIVFMALRLPTGD